MNAEASSWITPPAGSAPAPLSPARFALLGTPLPVTSYAELSRYCHQRVRRPGCEALEFTNTQIVALRRHDPAFRELTSAYDHFIPDSTPVLWCLNWRGAGMTDRVYGPTFMRECLRRTPASFTHYLLGGSPQCGVRLLELFRNLNPAVNFLGSFHGKCSPDGVLENDQAVVEEINRLSPDFIWVGLGTPKQDAWVKQHKSLIRRGVILSVGFAFDANAGTKRDAPPWMHRAGLGWLFRLVSEPRRLLGRYLKCNSLFLFYLFWDGIRGAAFTAREP